MKLHGLSLIISTHKNSQDLMKLIKQLHNLLSPTELGYEIFVIEKEKINSEEIINFFDSYAVKILPLQKKPSFSARIIQALKECHYDVIGTLSYPDPKDLKAIITMAREVYEGKRSRRSI